MTLSFRLTSVRLYPMIRGEGLALKGKFDERKLLCAASGLLHAVPL